VNARDELAGDSFQLAFRHRCGITIDSTLRSTEGDVCESGLPGHGLGERTDFIDVDARMEADSTLGRTASSTMLNAVSVKNFQFAIVQANGNLDLDLAKWRLQQLALLGTQSETFRRQVKIAIHDRGWRNTLK
jgi:hypothetical protein